MNGFTEAAAIHCRIEYHQGQGQQGKESLESHCCDRGHFSPHASDESRSDECLHKSKSGSQNLGSRTYEAYVKKFKIFLHHKPGSYRIKNLEDTGNEEYESCDEGTQPSEFLKTIFHNDYLFTASSTTAFTLAKISSGGSI